MAKIYNIGIGHVVRLQDGALGPVRYSREAALEAAVQARIERVRDAILAAATRESRIAASLDETDSYLRRVEMERSSSGGAGA